MKVELTGKGKLVALAALVVLAVFAAIHQGPDAKRYLKMETM
jgi:hypothetical protein